MNQSYVFYNTDLEACTSHLVFLSYCIPPPTLLLPLLKKNYIGSFSTFSSSRLGFLFDPWVVYNILPYLQMRENFLKKDIFLSLISGVILVIL